MGARDWYPTTMDGLAAWWGNLILRRPEFAAKYPILTTEAARLTAASAWMAYWVGAKHSFLENGKQITAYWNAISGNDPSVVSPLTPVVGLPPDTPAEVPPGIEYFIREIRRVMVNSANYAKADGEAMGFEGAGTPKPDPGNVKPTIDLTAAASNYHFSIVVSGRGEANMWDVYILRKGGSWTKVESASGKSADIHINPTVDGDAEQIQVRVQLRKNNQDYGIVSDPVHVTVNP